MPATELSASLDNGSRAFSTRAERAQRSITTSLRDREQQISTLPRFGELQQAALILGMPNGRNTTRAAYVPGMRGSDADDMGSLPFGYHPLDTMGVVREVDDTELRWLGYARDEVVGKLRFTDFLLPQDVDREAVRPVAGIRTWSHHGARLLRFPYTIHRPFPMVVRVHIDDSWASP